MHAQVKHAWFSLIVVGTATILVAGFYLVGLVYVGPKRALGAIGFLGLTGLLGFGGEFYRRKRGEKGVIMDERDTQICERSRMGSALLVAFGFWGVACMGPWCYTAIRYGIESTQTVGIPVTCLPILYMASAILFEAVRSVVVLVEYKRGDGGNEG